MRFTRTTRSGLVFCALLVLLSGVVGAHVLFAQEANTELIAKRRAQLEAQLAELEVLIQAQQKLLEGKQGERATLESDLKKIDAEIEKARLAIKAQQLVIADLEDDIVDKQAYILELGERIDRERESLASLIQRTDELDQLSLVEIIFSEKSLSEFFEEYDDFASVKIALRESFLELEDLREHNKTAKEQLEERKASEEELRSLKQLQQAKLADQENEKARILKVTKGEESKYQQLISANEKTASQIRSELFELRGSASINLGDAIEFASLAGTRTGIRPALILGVLKQETRLGEFLGNGVWTSDMHPTRDRPLYKVITSTLGLDPNRMPVSAAPSYGYGGAMGPAQFIPSTWACYGGYVNTKTGDCNNSSRSLSWDAFWAGPWEYRVSADRLRTIRGKQSPSNPWDNQDAFMAAAVLMKDNGADGGTLYAERLAALRYFAGWSNATNPAYAFYGDSVMQHAAYYQKQMDTLKDLE
jgi:peptidoglycan hydrolase CwlO-like protein